MLIDWFTVGAQIVNFLVLVWLLKRFAYGRILRAIDAREKRIATQVAEAAAREAEAHAHLAACDAKLADFEQQREALVQQARTDAEQQHAAMLADARERVRILEAKWRDDLERDRQTFIDGLRRRVAAETLDIARRVIADLTGNELEHCAVRVFLGKIRALDRAEWVRFGEGALCVRSRLEIAPAQREELRQTIEAQIGRPVELRFERSPAPGLGLELRGNGWRIDWNSESYLQRLEEDLNETFNERSGTGAAAQTAG